MTPTFEQLCRRNRKRIVDAVEVAELFYSSLPTCTATKEYNAKHINKAKRLSDLLQQLQDAK